MGACEPGRVKEGARGQTSLTEHSRKGEFDQGEMNFTGEKKKKR